MYSTSHGSASALLSSEFYCLVWTIEYNASLSPLPSTSDLKNPVSLRSRFCGESNSTNSPASSTS